MPSLMETGFVSEQQEKYLMINEPTLYKAVLKKHGHFGKVKNPSLRMNRQPRHLDRMNSRARRVR